MYEHSPWNKSFIRLTLVDEDLDGDVNDEDDEMGNRIILLSLRLGEENVFCRMVKKS